MKNYDEPIPIDSREGPPGSSVTKSSTHKDQTEGLHKRRSSEKKHTNERKNEPICSSTDSGRSSISGSHTSHGDDAQEKTELFTSTERINIADITEGRRKTLIEDIDIYSDVTLIPKSVETIGLTQKMGKHCMRKISKAKLNKPGRNKKPAASSVALKHEEPTISANNRDSATGMQKLAVNRATTSGLNCSRAVSSETISTVVLLNEPNGFPRNSSSAWSFNASRINLNSASKVEIHSDLQTINSNPKEDKGTSLETDGDKSQEPAGVDHSKDEFAKAMFASVEDINSFDASNEPCRHVRSCRSEYQSPHSEHLTSDNKTNHSRRMHAESSSAECFALNNEDLLSAPLIMLESNDSSFEHTKSKPTSKINARKLNQSPELAKMKTLSLDIRLSTDKNMSYSTSSSPVHSMRDNHRSNNSSTLVEQIPGSSIPTKYSSNMKSLLSKKPARNSSVRPLFSPEFSNTANHTKRSWIERIKRPLSNTALLPNPLMQNANCLCFQPMDSNGIVLNPQICWWLPGGQLADVRQQHQQQQTFIPNYAQLENNASELQTTMQSTTKQFGTSDRSQIDNLNHNDKTDYRIHNVPVNMNVGNKYAPNCNSNTTGPQHPGCTTQNVSTGRTSPDNPAELRGINHLGIDTTFDVHNSDIGYLVESSAVTSKSEAVHIIDQTTEPKISAQAVNNNLTDQAVFQYDPTDMSAGTNCSGLVTNASLLGNGAITISNIPFNQNTTQRQWNGDMQTIMVTPSFPDGQFTEIGGSTDSCALSANFLYVYNTDGQLFAIPSAAFYYPAQYLITPSDNSSTSDSAYNSPSLLVPTPGHPQHFVSDVYRGTLNGATKLDNTTTGQIMPGQELQLDRATGTSYEPSCPKQFTFPGYVNELPSWTGLGLSVDGRAQTSIPVPIAHSLQQMPYQDLPRRTILVTPNPSTFIVPSALPHKTQLNNNINTRDSPNPFVSDRQNLHCLSRKDDRNQNMDSPNQLRSTVSHKSTNKLFDGSKMIKSIAEPSGLLGHAKAAYLFSSLNNRSILGDCKQTELAEDTNRSTASNQSNAMRQKKHSSKTNLYIRGLPSTFTEQQLNTLAPEKELIRSVKLIAGSEGEMYGFIDFTSNAAARSALLHIKSTNRELYVNFAYESEKDPQNVYITNIPETWTAGNVDDLKKIFQPYGQIATAIVMTKRSNNFCTGAGFVRFVRAEDAQRAIDGLRSSPVTLDGSKGPLEVKLADRQKSADDPTNSLKGRPQKLMADCLQFLGPENRNDNLQEVYRPQSAHSSKKNNSCLLSGETITSLLSRGMNSSPHGGNMTARTTNASVGLGLLSNSTGVNAFNFTGRLPVPHAMNMAALQAALSASSFASQSLLLQNQINSLNFHFPITSDACHSGQTSLLAYPATSANLNSGLLSTVRGTRTFPGLLQNQSGPTTLGLFSSPTNLIPIMGGMEELSLPNAAINLSAATQSQPPAQMQPSFLQPQQQQHTSVFGHALRPVNNWITSPVIPSMFASM
ncbi:hypothetical protein EG68_00321 [Paragonimus skrjabini miyazakii]|uniref:RRM domain-containing protein n=1 Tax=Paragonimus skrjabini miyazakii TaxID=59628 RepID=A0A8S9Z4H6_9TREM|nr:hypothetical protein EG68_00321 [Paragonimus skrjabini miyazakii]